MCSRRRFMHQWSWSARELWYQNRGRRPGRLQETMRFRVNPDGNGMVVRLWDQGLSGGQGLATPCDSRAARLQPGAGAQGRRWRRVLSAVIRLINLAISTLDW